VTDRPGEDALERSFFVSYAHADGGYVGRLRGHLSGSGLPVWGDFELRWGDRFPHRISAQIAQSLAVIVVMSPAAENSAWVEREILEGQRHDREFLPILLSGERFFLLAATQYFDARTGSLPGDQEISQLRRLAESAAGRSPLPPLTLAPDAGEASTAIRRPPPEVSLDKLQQMLTDKRFEHADIMTTLILLDAAKRAGSGWMRHKDGENIPFGLLDRIDKAWSELTIGAHGFRTQLLLHRSVPPGAKPGGQRDFFVLAQAVGWKNEKLRTMPRYGEFVGSGDRPAGFFPTYRNPQLERVHSWYDHWRETVMAIQLQLRRWRGLES
jgi:TIR domain/GUN4-like